MLMLMSLLRSFMSGFDCANPETAANNLAITHLTLQVDSRFGTYAYCNVHAGNYTCLCQGYGPPTPGVDCTTKVGRANCSEHGHHRHSWGNVRRVLLLFVLLQFALLLLALLLFVLLLTPVRRR